MKISPSPTNLSISHVNVATGIPYDRLIPAFEASLGKWDPVAGPPMWEKKGGLAGSRNRYREDGRTFRSDGHGQN